MTRTKKDLTHKSSESVAEILIESSDSANSEKSKTAASSLGVQIEKDTEPEVDRSVYFFNRELSWIAFNKRVLHEGIDSRTPLLERAKFCAIFSTNLDEFFMVRIARVKKKLAEQIDIITDDGLTPQKQLEVIREALVPLVTMEHEFFENNLRQELHKNGVKLLDYKDIDKKHQRYLKTYFQEKLFPVLTPLAVDPAHPFPYISNLSLNLVVIVRDRETGEKNFARVKVPSVLPRFVKIPETDDHTFVPLEQVIAHNLDALFPGMEIMSYYPFRITRDAELDIEEEEADDLISALQEELRKQKFGSVVRMEIANDIPTEIRQELIEQLGITEADVYDIPGLIGLGDLMAIAFLPMPEHQDKPWKSVTHPRLKDTSGESNIFEIIREGAFLVHHPYQSFTTTVQRFIEEAALDPNVLAIKQTLYRTSGDSPIVHALIGAAENGKQVAVLVELKARFDEANNILWAKKLENAGVHVVYGLKNLKTHTKTALVVRQEGDRLVRYVHIGTGNYNPKTARFYSDLGIFSCSDDLGADLTDLFNYLTGYSRQRDYRKLLVAPVNMRDRFLQLIHREIEHQKKGYPSYIIAKMNSLVDPEIITALYEASQVGVNVDLIIRGICCIRPKVKGLSERIRVISVIGRFLEHSRIFYFSNGGQEQVYIGSADWMPRNLDARVEVITPIEDTILIQELKQILEIVLADNRQAWDLKADGTYIQRIPKDDEPEMSSQKHFMSQGRPEFA
ncbi:polyphosphate kinase 1 [Pseudanabaena sp. FACHB-1998]|uniref:polyphosphate kinase 1 n=1 Tax=Pseudanabaena sp. FACHB-1998 TaxID=2692858 RepID=UPI0016815981|nr:polyphosphate kinase 1 [Pseudanabaena sp. FACHB-1998]MBD2177658.1 polyphosphate kinase 1 [Pseudanabaena sp. FACHB-1998]